MIYSVEEDEMAVSMWGADLKVEWKLGKIWVERWAIKGFEDVKRRVYYEKEWE